MIAKTFHINNYKDLNYALPTDSYLTPKVVYMELSNSRCQTYDLLVKTGDTVKIGQVLAKKSCGFFDLPVHATVSGTVGEIKKMWSGTGVEESFLELFNDFEETLHESIQERSDDALEKMSKEDMIGIIKDRAIIGLGGSAFPTYIKLETKETIEHVVINAAECEPYLSSDYRAIKDFTEEIVKGLHYVMKIVGAKQGHIAVKKTKKTLIETLTIEMAKYDEVMSVKPLKDFYPQGWENATFKVALGITVPIGKLPMAYGVLGINVSTAAAIYNALKFNLPITERYVTMNGDALNYPQNLRVKVGTNVKDLIEASDGFKEEADKIDLISGGPMMGRSIPTEEIIITPTTTSILAFKINDYVEEPCVRCGSCILSCPADLQPVSIMNAVKRKDMSALKAFDTKNCIECGLCSYVCTSKINVTDYVKKGKAMIL
jgi:Na+-translocating ferredoxin:NAD+ oxidoreductase subunit C